MTESDDDLEVEVPPDLPPPGVTDSDELQRLFQQGISVHGRAMVEERVITAQGVTDWNELAVLNGYQDPQEMLADLYLRKGYSFHECSIRLKVSSATIRMQLAKQGITPRRRGGRRNTKGCQAVDAALIREGTTMQNLLHLHDTAYQVAKFLNLEPHRVYSYIRVNKIPLPRFHPTLPPIPKEEAE